MAQEFKLPNLGEGIKDGTVVNVLVKEGDQVSAKQNVLELETAKAVMDIESSVAGKVTKVHVKAGDKLPVGGMILTVEGGQSTVDSKAQAPKAESPSTIHHPPSTSTPTPAPQFAKAAAPAPQPVVAQGPVAGIPLPQPGERPAPASPSVRKLARELGVDLHRIQGTGPGGRISEADIQTYVKGLVTAVQTGGMPSSVPSAISAPLPDFSKWGQVERRAMGGIKKATAEAMSRAWSLIPHVTQFDGADITELEAARKRLTANVPKGAPKVTMTVLAIKAAVAALKAYPQFNSSLDTQSQELILKKYFHVGVAVDTENGLVVPVIRDADRKSVQELANELEVLANKAKARKLSLEEMQGGCFTISNLGGIGGTGFTPIVNWPEVSILGIARSKQEFVWRESGSGAFRLMLPLSLSYDHRVIDGADGARFLRKISELLSDPLQILMQS
jgi:pyruvate dehydrogenase E2 component (dihydrolipoamide acetyltransferase)